MLTLHSFLFFLAILLSSSMRDKTEALRSLGRDNKELFVNNQRAERRTITQTDRAFDLSRDKKSVFEENSLCCDGNEISDRSRQEEGGRRKQAEDAQTDSWEEMQEGPSDDVYPLERPEEALERVETVDMRRRVEDRM